LTNDGLVLWLILASRIFINNIVWTWIYK
jgi:hypothetical protein